jgi:hypothetical protein
MTENQISGMVESVPVSKKNLDRWWIQRKKKSQCKNNWVLIIFIKNIYQTVFHKTSQFIKCIFFETGFYYVSSELK